MSLQNRMAMRKRLGLGAGDPTAQTVLSTAATGGGIALTIPAIAAAAGPAAPFVLAGIAIAALLSHFIGGGCGPACTNAAMAEQIYEAAADNAYILLTLGMVTTAEAVAFMQHMIYAGQQHEAQFGTDQATKGATNLASVINAEISAAQSLGDQSPAPVDLNVAHSHYVQSGNWYSQSLAAAAQLTDQWLSTIAASRPEAQPAPAATGPSAVDSGNTPSANVSPAASSQQSTAGLPAWVWIVGLGFAAWKLL